MSTFLPKTQAAFLRRNLKTEKPCAPAPIHRGKHRVLRNAVGYSALNTYRSRRFIASCTRLRGRARFKRIEHWGP